MKIIEITAAHHFDYKTFFLKGLTEHRDNFRISPEDEMHRPFPTDATPDSFTLGAISEENQLMGVVSFQREGKNREKLRHKGLLFRMYVSAQYAGKGVGKELIGQVIDRANSLKDIEQINLTVLAHNTRAEKLYESFGFTTFAYEKNALKDGQVYYHEKQMVLFL